MRYFWIAIGTAILHRLLVWGIFILGFGFGMTAFDGSSLANLAKPLWYISAILDFPATIAGNLIWLISPKPSSHMNDALGFAAASLFMPLIWQWACSLGIGISISYMLFRRDKAKRGGRPAPIWKSGL